MGWDGSGNVIRTNGTNTGQTVWQQDRDEGINIRADRHDTHDQDLANAIEKALNREGENAMAADLDMGGNSLDNLGAMAADLDMGGTNKIVNLADGVASDDAATLGQVSERATTSNLLINGDFAINQRSFIGGALGAGDYGYDRWGTPTGDGGADVTESGGTITLASGTLVQVIEAPDLAGKNVTVSAEDPSVDITADVEGVTGTIQSGSGRISVTLAVPGASTGDITLKLSAGSSVDFSRVKLERGDFATPWIPRLPGEETALCLRYYEKSKITISHANPTITAPYTATFFHAVPMRTTPAISTASDGSGNYDSSTSTSIDGKTTGIILTYGSSPDRAFARVIVTADAEFAI